MHHHRRWTGSRRSIKSALNSCAGQLAQAASQLAAIRTLQPDRLIGGEGSLHRSDSNHQQGGPPPMQGIAGTGIQRQRALGLQRMSQPAATVPQRFRVGMKHRASAFPLKQGIKARWIPTIRQVHGDAAGGGDPGRRQLGGHAAAAPTSAVTGDGFKGVQLPRVMHIGNRAGIGDKPRIR